MAATATDEAGAGLRSGRRLNWRTLPVIRELRTSIGVQRGMLLAGVVITALFVLVAIFASLIAPYGYAQLQDANGSFGPNSHPAVRIFSAPRSAAMTFCPGCSGVPRPRCR